jgi:hypothetical protein
VDDFPTIAMAASSAEPTFERPVDGSPYWQFLAGQFRSVDDGARNVKYTYQRTSALEHLALKKLETAMRLVRGSQRGPFVKLVEMIPL